VSRAVVFGGGRVGGLIARELATDPSFEVVVVDRSVDVLATFKDIAETRSLEVNDREAIISFARGADVAVGAVPGALGNTLLAALIEAGVPVADISFAADDARALHGAAVEAGVPIVFDIGVAPGFSNVLAAEGVRRLDTAESVFIWVGGLPFRRCLPYEYRSVFSPTDVIEEYVRPCRMKVDGDECVVPALSGCELVSFAPVGTLEAFYTDGLRSLIDTLDVPTLREKTLRYPGHAERMAMLRDTGFFDEARRTVDGVSVVPRQVTESLLFPHWELPAGEEEFTLLRVEVHGQRNGYKTAVGWQLFDRGGDGATSMARTTGLPCVAAARRLVEGSFTRPGVYPPEDFFDDSGSFDDLRSFLVTKGVSIESLTLD
jgi:saccharopine dehydrogenase-like NADP-dependent oxidoreductase